MKILITVVAGFIGFHIAKDFLKNNNIYVYGIDNFDNYYSIKYKKFRVNILKKNKKFYFKNLDIRHNKKIKGDKFEVFCVYYLYDIYGMDNVWRLEDVPEEVLTKLGMKRRDMGIDIIGEKGNKYYAIQCKYKKYSDKKTVLTWKELSTFYALCLKTGPWEKYIVMTNCDYTRQAVRTEKDLIICKKQFQKITKEKWLKMCNVEGKKLNEPIIEAPKEDVCENEYLNKEDK